MSQTRTLRKPAYQRIKDSILKKIHAGKWQAGDAIPTEMALAKQYSVSRMTVNRALKELSDDRVLERRQGSGTYVAQQQYNHTVVEVRNIAADIKATGKDYQAKVINQQRLQSKDVHAHILSMFEQPMLEVNNNHQQTTWATTQETSQRAKTNQALPSTKTAQTISNPSKSDDDNNLAVIKAKTKTEIGAEIFEIEIVHIADGQPVQFEERWVDASLVPQFIEQDFTVVNTSDYLISKAPLQGGSYTIRAVAAPKKVAAVLDIAVGEPALLLSRQTYSAGRVVTFVNMWHAGSRYQFSGTL